ncbi:zincin-like metallopeptidase domain-containing protein [Burkholderia contaminans]|uniref:zincin-like metallopeptidase domain-containing protein n=1 Tax=Burkholderia contaminans TaxID=488447 RepID=UPI00158B85EA|nr:zincin-like metallopeptidase domain-containing protein [Burkholderia contaminans]
MAWNKDYKNKQPEELTDARLDVTMRVLARMKEARDDGVKYQKGWNICEEFPYNPISGKDFTGMNVLGLLAYGYSDPRFIPAGEVQKLFKETEGKVRIKKGEKSCRVVWAQIKTKGTGETDLETGDEKTISYPTYKYHPTYNVEQLEGLDIINEKFPRKAKVPLNEYQECEFIKDVMEAMKATGLKYETHSIGQNYYMPAVDTIKMCVPGLFQSEPLYYRTLLHETGHATGHESRCNRNQTGSKGSKDYAYEELCAELYSFYMGLETGVPYDRRTHDNHDAYLNSWIDVLSDPKDEAKAKTYLINAASEAFKGFDYTMQRVQELRASRGQQNANSEEKTAISSPSKVEEKPKKKLELAA